MGGGSRVAKTGEYNLNELLVMISTPKIATQQQDITIASGGRNQKNRDSHSHSVARLCMHHSQVCCFCSFNRPRSRRYTLRKKFVLLFYFLFFLFLCRVSFQFYFRNHREELLDIQ